MIYFLFAMQREADMIDVPNKYVIGINGTDMPNTTDNDIIVNLGYCGAYKIPVGTIVEPSVVFDVKTRRSHKIDKKFKCHKSRCYTSDEFVTKPIVNYESIYDMELFKISQLPHKKLYSLKIVSDNLNEQDCENFNDKESWDKVKSILEAVYESSEETGRRNEPIERGNVKEQKQTPNIRL